MVMADGRPKENTLDRDDRASGSTPQEIVEAKRLEARRRFLLGGAAALPVLITMTGARAAPITLTACAGILGFGSGLAPFLRGLGFDSFIDLGVCSEEEPMIQNFMNQQGTPPQ